MSSQTETATQRRARWIAGCLSVNLTRLANLDDRSINALENVFGRINFDARYYDDPVYQTHNGRFAQLPEQMVAEMQYKVVEKVQRLVKVLAPNNVGSTKVSVSDFGEITKAGHDLARYKLTYPMQFPTCSPAALPCGGFLEVWKDLVIEIANDRLLDWPTRYRVNHGVSSEDWDRLFALYLIVTEIELAIGSD
ncbi:MAG: hypothetical protein Q9195_005171 [Heterodermia aff. obscurata]